MPVQQEFTCACGAKCRVLADAAKGFAQLDTPYVKHCTKGERYPVPGHFIELQELRDGQWVTIEKKQG